MSVPKIGTDFFFLVVYSLSIQSSFLERFLQNKEAGYNSDRTLILVQILNTAKNISSLFLKRQLKKMVLFTVTDHVNIMNP